MLGLETLDSYLSELSAKRSTPGGGAVAAITGTQAAGLIAMVAEFSGKTMPEPIQAETIEKSHTAISLFLQLADQDAENFKHLMACYKANTGVESASIKAAEPPLECLALSATLAPLITTLAKYGNKNLATDTGIASLLLINTIQASEMNVLINLRSIKDQSFIDAAKNQIQHSKGYIGELKAISEKIVEDLSFPLVG